VLNIVPIINEYSFILTPEHFLYLPVVGGIIVFALIIKQLISLNHLRAIAVVVCLGLGAQTIYQNTFWSGEIPLFERMVSFEGEFARGHMLLAKAYFSNKQTDWAIDHYNQSLRIMKMYALKATNDKARRFYQGFIKEINFYLAQCFTAKGQLDQAIAYYKEALQIDSRDVSLLNNLAVCYIQQGDKSQAEQILKIALGFNPLYIPARENLNRLINSQ
ncbi:MAG: tetratricopeptide repeat protein, partial [Candidatus Omnitrophota bacterium]